MDFITSSKWTIIMDQDHEMFCLDLIGVLRIIIKPQQMAWDLIVLQQAVMQFRNIMSHLNRCIQIQKPAQMNYCYGFITYLEIIKWKMAKPFEMLYTTNTRQA